MEDVPMPLRLLIQDRDYLETRQQTPYCVLVAKCFPSNDDHDSRWHPELAWAVSPKEWLSPLLSIPAVKGEVQGP